MKKLVQSFLLTWALVSQAYANEPEPIIDVHLHAESAASMPPGQKMCMEMLRHVPPVDPGKDPILRTLGEWNQDPGCDDPMVASATNEDLMRDTIAILRRYNIRGVVGASPDVLEKWMSAAPNHVIPSRHFSLGFDAEITPEDIEREFKAGKFEVLGEVTNQYHGFAPNAPEFDAYWAMAERNDIPVGIHIGGMPPGAAYWGMGGRIAIGNSLMLEDVLLKYPKLRVYIMHSGFPQIENTIALMQQYPQVYAETGVMQTVMTKEGYEDFLRRMINAGLEKRLMYGTDQMAWPDMIPRSLKLVEDTDVLTPEQKRNFLYHNAVRFFRLDE